jgi:hypothetical protein
MLYRLALAAAIGAALLCAGAARAATLIADLTADNAFTYSISTDDLTTGTLIGAGEDWHTTYSFSATLEPGSIYYIHVAADNFADAGDIAAFIGSFTLRGTGFAFTNGTQTLQTNPADWGVRNVAWKATKTGATAQYETPISYGANGVGPWGLHTGIDPTALNIWSADECTDCTRYFSAAIVGLTPVPEPSQALLVATGLLGLGAAVRRLRC